jgi:phage baseplate assembly protein W
MFLRRKFLGERRYTELEDIRSNLQNVLTSKRGSSYFLPTFGLTETGYRTPEEMLTQMTREIEENIRLYEPRLQVIEIDEQYADNGSVRLEVVCALKRTSERIKIVMVSNGGLVSIDDLRKRTPEE